MRNPILVGRRVYLRPIEPADAESIANSTHTETETFFQSGRLPTSPIAEEKWIKSLYEKQPPGEVTLAACLVADDDIIGFVGLDDLDWTSRTAETHSYFGLAEHRGRGYGTEAKLLLLKYAFDHLNLHAIRSMVFERNERSWRALLKQGYQPAGRLRAHWPKDGQYLDALCFDVLRDEWFAAYQRWQAETDRPTD